MFCVALFWFVFYFVFCFCFCFCFGFGFGFSFASLRLCVFAFPSSGLPILPFEPLRSRLRVDFLWTNRKSERFGEAVQGVGCRSGIDGMGRLSIAEDFAQTSDIRIGDLGRIAG